MEQREKQEREALEDAPQVEVFSQGKVRFIRLQPGSDDSEGLAEGASTSVRFNVLKAGKRSADGLSGQGTSVFSTGYMLEDDEKVSGEDWFVKRGYYEGISPCPVPKTRKTPPYPKTPLPLSAER